MTVAGGVVAAGRRYAVAREAPGDGVEAQPAVNVLIADALDDRRGDRVESEAVEALAICGLPGVRMGTGVYQAVAVRRPTAEESTFAGGLIGHRGPHADLDAIAFALAHTPVERHDQVVGVRARVDAAADLRDP